MQFSHPHMHAGSDFNTTVIETVLGPNILELTSSTGFNVPLISDSKLENVEVFLVLLNVISTEDVTIGRRCAIGRLLGSLDPDQDGTIITSYTA